MMAILTINDLKPTEINLTICIYIFFVLYNKDLNMVIFTS